MIKEYFEKLKLLWLHPSVFFDRNVFPPDEKQAVRFAVITGLLAALELGLVEAFTGGSLSIVALVTFVLLVGMPFLVTLWVFLWSGFMRLCAFLLGETLPMDSVRPVVAYSAGGLAALGLGLGIGKWLALSMVVFQLLGIEKALGCSRWTAVVYVGLPFSMVGVMTGLLTLMFKVY